MGKKRRRMNSDKFASKNSSWIDAVLKTQELSSKIDEVVEVVKVAPAIVEAAKPATKKKATTRKKKAVKTKTAK